MRISDWSSDVCSSDLLRRAETACVHATRIVEGRQPVLDVGLGGDRLQPVARRARHPGITRLAREPRQQLHREITLRTHFLDAIFIRSEEHTSELQSLMRSSYAVFCLKKKHEQTSID